MISRQTEIGTKPKRTVGSGADSIHAVVEQRVDILILMPEQLIARPAGHSYVDTSRVAAHPNVVLPVHRDGVDTVTAQCVARVVRYVEQQPALQFLTVKSVDTLSVDTYKHRRFPQRGDGSDGVLYLR